MLEINVFDKEFYDESTNEFIKPLLFTLELEHSLVSLSKWESIFETPFLGPKEKTTEEIHEYIKLMTLTPNVPEDIFLKVFDAHLSEVDQYINAKMTATWFREVPTPKSREVITSELIYYWMTVFNIPFECETWHLNRLFTLIRICNVKHEKPKKMSRSEAAAHQREQNARRKAQMGTRG